MVYSDESTLHLKYIILKSASKILILFAQLMSLETVWKMKQIQIALGSVEEWFSCEIITPCLADFLWKCNFDLIQSCQNLINP